MTKLWVWACTYPADGSTNPSNPHDPGIDCGGLDPNHPQHDIAFDHLIIDNFGSTPKHRRVRARAHGNTFVYVQAFLFDGPDENGPGNPDLAYSTQDFGQTGSPNVVEDIRWQASCGSTPAHIWCETSPDIVVNEVKEGDELGTVFGGFVAAAYTNTLFAVRAQTRPEITLFPAVFKALFREDPTINIEGIPCGTVSGGHAGTVAQLAFVLAVPVLGRRLRGRRV